MGFLRHDSATHPRPTVDCSNDVVLVEQSHKKECDMHHIMRKFRETGVLNHVKEYEGKYMDMADPISFQEAMNTVTQAQQMFDSVPSHIRKRFGNDPVAYLEFVQNPDNLPELREMGLARAIEKPVQEETPAEPVVEPPA